MNSSFSCSDFRSNSPGSSSSFSSPSCSFLSTADEKPNSLSTFFSTVSRTPSSPLSTKSLTLKEPRSSFPSSPCCCCSSFSSFSSSSFSSSFSSSISSSFSSSFSSSSPSFSSSFSPSSSFFSSSSSSSLSVNDKVRDQSVFTNGGLHTCYTSQSQLTKKKRNTTNLQALQNQ